ncbi:S-formylglutathione hydrolase [Hyphomonas sp.]|uniref:S-formylglutathione hydrolase n=1 Tax=Hyphomonas sp. TaxID=87 RepID=UPI00391CA31E
MTTLNPVSSWKSFGGTLSVHDHESALLGCTMRFAVYTPPQAKDGPVPVLWYLSGLTCTWANMMEKSGVQQYAAEHGLMIIAPDTSPRGDHMPDDPAYDLGQGAGFYLTATEAPWAEHYRMDQYITDELPGLIAANFPADMARQGIFGHSMGGHGAITLHLKHKDRYRSCSAFSPITSPARVPWGQKAFTAYLGPLSVHWEAYDSTELVKERQSPALILVDTGTADSFLEKELKPEIFIEACERHGQRLDYRMREGYGHDYYFIATFMGEHVAHHAKALKA